MYPIRINDLYRVSFKGVIYEKFNEDKYWPFCYFHERLSEEIKDIIHETDDFYIETSQYVRYFSSLSEIL